MGGKYKSPPRKISLALAMLGLGQGVGDPRVQAATRLREPGTTFVRIFMQEAYVYVPECETWLLSLLPLAVTTSLHVQHAALGATAVPTRCSPSDVQAEPAIPERLPNPPPGQQANGHTVENAPCSKSWSW
ncbi:uncharacterized protein MYCGRDRAFT_96628 [Zymoseptoria tritici IPO323]|uniref:Uncharacterized protein n=1 Tax=Zymoseptoria tritici (strain CBS 115943 / IPO323) TaxID=336722 RepID=F9XN00_ZYMTI|nr:uncharacterized protein MYCGRDRAFT_96628 [Zymoseptoria tritici IPO323]EGP83603.1 hypothetical protein MYCGRDRAFT_96628 [Zymoseptoria tritici IPO323]